MLKPRSAPVSPPALQEHTVVKNFFSEVARASDRLQEQDRELTQLRQESEDMRHRIQHLEDELRDFRRQRDGASGAFYELAAQIGAVQTQAAALVEACAAAKRSANDQMRRVQLDPGDGSVTTLSQLEEEQAQQLGKQFGAANRLPEGPSG